MKKLYATLLAVLLALPMTGLSKTVPYSSDIGVNSAIDPEWTAVNNGPRGSKGFSWDYQTSDFSTREHKAAYTTHTTATTQQTAG